MAGDILNTCTASNAGDDCAIQTCSCEVQFVSQLMGILWAFGSGYKPQYSHNNGFDPDAECQIYVTGEKDWQCCGEFPQIMPYNAYDKSCCHQTLPFDADYQLCCNDGSVNYYSQSCDNRRKRRSVNDFYVFVENSHFYES